MSLALAERRKITAAKGRQLRAKIESLIDAEKDAAFSGACSPDERMYLRKVAERRRKALEKFIRSIEDI